MMRHRWHRLLVSLLFLLQGPLATSDDDTSCPWSCANGAECLYSDQHNQWYCDCPHTENTGFQGFHCETPYRDCHDGGSRRWRCYNGGGCGDSGNTCKCGKDFSGKFCDEYQGDCESTNQGIYCESSDDYEKSGVYETTNKRSKGVDVVGIVVGIMVGVVITFIALASYFACQKQRQPRKKLSKDKGCDSETPEGDMPVEPLDDAEYEEKAEII